MVETALLTSDIELGKDVVNALDDDSVGLRSALWLYFPDASEWRLVLALPIVDKHGPDPGYRAVQKSLHEHHVPLPLRRVAVIGTTEPLATAVRRLIRTPSIGTSDFTIHSTSVNGLVIEGAHVYRST